ncbi:MAG: hypothetical protein ACTHKC_02600 [Candidatus Nitrosocosmicus sp.]
METSKKNNLYAKNERWVVERTNSWHNRSRKLFVLYEKKVEKYLGLVQLSCSIVVYRKIILGIGSNLLKIFLILMKLLFNKEFMLILYFL